MPNTSTRIVSLAIISVVVVGVFYWYNQQASSMPNPQPSSSGIATTPTAKPSTTPTPTQLPSKSANTTGIPLSVPNGFSISTLASNLPNARVIVFDHAGNLWVSQPSTGTISKLTLDQGKVVSQIAVFKGLNKPHGLAFDPSDPSILYIAEENKISKVSVDPVGKLKKLVDLPTGGEHFSRTIGFGPDGRLYVSIGSTCNACTETDARRASVFSMNKDGSDFKAYAKGLRNSVFFAWNPNTKALWATEMGRDNLGDNIPPDEINIIKDGGNYGWPICYGKNIHDSVFDKNTYIRDPCSPPGPIASTVDLPAHSAPLGLAFVTNKSWPTDYRNNLIVALHGSWNRTTPTGYKLVRLQFDSRGNYTGMQDFISGWLTGAGKTLGRPVDAIFGPDGNLYVTDDNTGNIYKISYAGK